VEVKSGLSVPPDPADCSSKAQVPDVGARNPDGDISKIVLKIKELTPRKQCT